MMLRLARWVHARPLAHRLSEGLGLNAICLLKHEYSKDKLDGCAGERSNDCRRPRKSQRKASRCPTRTRVSNL